MAYKLSSRPVTVTQTLPQKSKPHKIHFLLFLFLIGDAFSLSKHFCQYHSLAYCGLGLRCGTVQIGFCRSRTRPMLAPLSSQSGSHRDPAACVKKPAAPLRFIYVAGSESHVCGTRGFFSGEWLTCMSH